MSMITKNPKVSFIGIMPLKYLSNTSKSGKHLIKEVQYKDNFLELAII